MTHRLKVIDTEESWYKDGLRFECTGCGQCCTGSPGYTWVNEKEIIEIAQFLKLSIDEFSKKYLRIVGDKIALLELQQTFDCVFLKDKKCQIYSVRPTQCKTFPWWQKNLKTIEDWKNAARYCEGIRPDAPLVPHSVIQQQLNKTSIGK